MDQPFQQALPVLKHFDVLGPAATAATLARLERLARVALASDLQGDELWAIAEQVMAQQWLDDDMSSFLLARRRAEILFHLDALLGERQRRQIQPLKQT